LYFTFPVVIILAVSANFVWEILRVNLSAHTIASWPFRFTIIDAPTTATILAVFISLFMGRLQWARTLRPTAGIGIDDDGAQFRLDSDVWRVWIYNAGPGAATIESVNYFVRFKGQPEGSEVVDWVPLPLMNALLQSGKLEDGKDYFIRWYGHGAPFPAVQKYSEGMQLAWFTVRALSNIHILDVRIRYVDSLGDVHERKIPLVHRLPSVTVDAIRAHLAPGPVNP
jgi:hypothetical protein